MHARSELIYRYDGTLDGLLCCVFESYAHKELPGDIVIQGEAVETLLFEGKAIPTDQEKARRVRVSIPQKICPEAWEFVQKAFLTCLPRKEVYLLLFLRLGYRHGSEVMQMLADDTVHTLFKAVRHLERESHLFKGFVRFVAGNGVLAAQIEPKNFVLPLLAEHFCQRFPEERFLIHDQSHGVALVYQPYQYRICPVEELELPAPDAEEQTYQELWKLFYKSIEIKARHNPLCRRTQMPQRYWKNMTEVASKVTRLPGGGKKDKLLQEPLWKLK